MSSESQVTISQFQVLPTDAMDSKYIFDIAVFRVLSFGFTPILILVVIE